MDRMPAKPASLTTCTLLGGCLGIGSIIVLVVLSLFVRGNGPEISPAEPSSPALTLACALMFGLVGAVPALFDRGFRNPKAIAVLVASSYAAPLLASLLVVLLMVS